MSKPFFLNAFSRLWLVVAVLIAGCASQPARTTDIAAPDGFIVQGRLGVRNGSDGFSSNFHWAHGPEGYQIELWGPLGQGRTRLVGSEGELTVYTADGKVYVERDSSRAMRQWFGFSVPIDALTHWIRGRQAPDYTTDGESRDAEGDLVELHQLTWAMQFSGYRSDADGRRLPARIVATRADVKVTLIPKEWSFSPTFQ